MGEAKRRKERARLRQGLEVMRVEGQGIWQTSIYNRAGVADLMTGALAGDRRAKDIAGVVARMIRHVETACPPMLCLTCDNEVTATSMPAAFVVMHADRDDPTQAACNVICEACHARNPSPMALAPSVTDAIRVRIIPDLRVIQPVNDEGHA